MERAYSFASKKRILCVEDNCDCCELLQVCLTDYELVIAETYAEALQLAQNQDFDLYLLDNWLPDGSGIELCRELRILRPRVPVAFLSGVVNETTVKEALSAGAQIYLSKPFDILNLKETIAKLLEQSQLAQLIAI